MSLEPSDVVFVSGFLSLSTMFSVFIGVVTRVRASFIMLRLWICATLFKTSLVAQRLKRLPPMRETQVRSLGQEDPQRRKWQSTPVFLPGESHGRRSLVGYSPRGRKESDTTE